MSVVAFVSFACTREHVLRLRRLARAEIVGREHREDGRAVLGDALLGDQDGPAALDEIGDADGLIRWRDFRQHAVDEIDARPRCVQRARARDRAAALPRSPARSTPLPPPRRSAGRSPPRRPPSRLRTTNLPARYASESGRATHWLVVRDSAASPRRTLRPSDSALPATSSAP